MRLSDLLVYDDILIQCHDNPDGDALASGYGIYYYLTLEGKNPRFVYAGKYPLKKSNLLLMVKELNIPIEFLSPEEISIMDETGGPELLINVDCQYGEGNVTKLPAKTVAVIDHHQIGKCEPPKLSRIVPSFGACATLVYQLLGEEGIDIKTNDILSTALYYGLMTDTNNFSELSHPMDRNLQDDAKCRMSLIRLFKNANVSLEEIKIAGDALCNYTYNEKHKYAIVEARPCDPNILGLISDMMLEADVVDTCLVYSIQPFGTKISVRSCVKEVKADELAAYLTEGAGNGGGHLDKAGGFIRLLGEEAKAHLEERMNRYFEESEIIDVDSYEACVDGWKKYTKLPIHVGYVRGLDVAKEHKKVVVRTLEGDQLISIEKDTYIMIGIQGEIYPISEDKFNTKYQRLEGEYVPHFEYNPELIDGDTGLRINLVKKAKKCVSTGKGNIYATKLDHRVKIFTVWDRERYYLGVPGDYIAVREDDLRDVYIIAGKIFPMTYKEM